MSRPRHDSEILPAKERLENAFWTLLEEHDYDRITVTDVVHAAQVNRNSFYYHYSGLPELADSSILHEVERLPMPIYTRPDGDPNVEWRHFCVRLLNDPEQLQHLNRLSLLVGPHSNEELVESLRDFLRMTLLTIVGSDMVTVEPKTKMLVDFCVGGIISSLYNWPQLRNQISADDMLDSDVAILAMGLFLTMADEDPMSYWRRIVLGYNHVHNHVPSFIAPGDRYR